MKLQNTAKFNIRASIFQNFPRGMPLDPLYSIAMLAMQLWTVRGPTSFV